ncbi:MAG: IS1 family transposase, partial [Methylophilaceae bacterium]
MAVTLYIPCPACNQTNSVKCNGHSANGKQRYYCDPSKGGCKKSFIHNYSNLGCLIATKKRVIDMVLNGSGINDISRVLSISHTTVIDIIKAKASTIRKVNFDKAINLSKVLMLELSVELDEQWSWVQNKGNQRWLWAALD